MKIATWNVNSLKVRLEQVIDWIEENQPDILVLQELKLANEFFPLDAFQKIGYQACFNGQKTYNGVAIISRFAAQQVVSDNPYLLDPQKRIIAATINGIRIINVYCVNGEALGSEKFLYKKKWFNYLTQYVKELIQQYRDVILLGDFNIAPSDLDVYDATKWHEKILCSSEERAWYQAILALGLNDSLRALDTENHLFTWWDYRMNGFKRNLGMRIDHILVSDTLMPQLSTFGIDIAMRGHDRPSDHAPVWIKLKI